MSGLFSDTFVSFTNLQVSCKNLNNCVEFSLLKSIDFIVINVRLNEKLQAVKLQIREINQCLNCVYQVKVIHKILMVTSLSLKCLSLHKNFISNH